METKVLDKGYVKLLDVFGDEHRILANARLCSGNKDAAGTDKDIKLFEFLIEKRHFSVLEHCVFYFEIKAPIFVNRQWFRHRIASYSEMSGRYNDLSEIDFYTPSSKRINSCIGIIESICIDLLEQYEYIVNDKVPKEIARIILPLNMYSTFRWTINLRSLLNFLDLRLEKHAQWEIRQYAAAIFNMIRDCGKFDNFITIYKQIKYDNTDYLYDAMIDDNE